MFGGGGVYCVVVDMFVFVRGYGVLGVKCRFAVCRAIKHVVFMLCIWHVFWYVFFRYFWMGTVTEDYGIGYPMCLRGSVL